MDKINLQQIINDYPDCVTNGTKLKGILLDTYPDIPKAIVNTLVIMVNSGIAKEIRGSENITELDKSRWQQKLEDEGFAENVICTCLNIFFFAVGLKVICMQNDTKVDTSYIVEKKIEKQVLPTDLSDFEIKDGVLVKYKGTATNVVIPDCVTVIGYRSFSKFSKLTSVTISDSVTSIDDFAFADCSGLTSITIPNNVTSIGEGAFASCCELKNIVIPDGIDSIDMAMFSGCSGLTSIMIPNSVTRIGNHAFQCCSGIANMVIPDRVTCIGSQSFMGCRKLKNVVIPNSVTYIGNWAFRGCSDLGKIIFNGTIEKWNNINKGIDYLKNTTIKAIHCSDGIIHV